MPGSTNRPDAAKITAGLVLALGMGLYMAGYLFLLIVRQPPQTATPWTVWDYWQAYGDREDIRQKLLAALAVGQAVGLGIVGFALMPRPRPLHGEARFARRREIEKIGLLGQEGIILGRFGNRYLTLPGQQGVALEAPPRSGKGVGVVIPNLLNWPGSTIVSDIKGENFSRTAGFRAANGQAVFLFDPLSDAGRSARWNPLGYVSDVPYRRIDDLQRIATMLFPDPQGADPFWTSSARSLFLGIALYLFETAGATRTLGEVLRQGMANDDEGFQKHWKRVIGACEKAGRPLSNVAVQSLYDVIDLAPVTASSIRKTFTSRLDLWLNPMIDAATAGNDFDLRDLRKRPISIYVRINPDNIARLQPLLNLFFQQAIGLQTHELPEHNPELRHQLLLMLDEFPALGRIPVIAESTAFLPGYNVRTVVIVQSQSQMVEKYGIEGAKSIRKMLAARIVFPPKEYDDAEQMSRELGTYTVRQRSISKPMMGPNWGSSKASRSGSVSTSDQSRRLLLAQEVKDLGAEHMLLFYEGLRPVLAERIYYFRDKLLAKRELPPPAVPRLDVEAAAAVKRQARAPVSHDDDAEQSTGGGQRARHAGAEASTDPLDAFSLSFENIDIPQEGPISDEAVEAFTDRFLSQVVV